MESITRVLVSASLAIPYVYNAGEWRISKLVLGPRGGKHWVRIISQPATGGIYETWLEPGQYKETYWTNGWPTSSIFTVTPNGDLDYEDAEFDYDED